MLRDSGDGGLRYRERPARGPASGLLVLHHGRGTDERDLLGVADALDPEQRLHVVSPRAPLAVEGMPGFHWYLVPRVGHPDPDTFHQARARLAALHDVLWEQTGIGPERTVLGGFSMGAVMSYATSLDARRPRPAGTLAFSGFLPEVAGWQPDLAARGGLAVLITHGSRDQVIDVRFARAAERTLREGGLAVEYHESRGAHEIDSVQLRAAALWLHERMAAGV